jgi:hypothetical protein
MQIPFVASYASIVESKENVDPSGALSSQSEISSDNNSAVEDTQEMLQTIPEDRPNSNPNETAKLSENVSRINELSEFTTKPLGAESITAPSNQSEGTSISSLTNKKLIPKSMVPDVTVINNLYTVKVTFDSMTVHNNHKGLLSGDGEFDIVAYVHANRVGLTDPSGPGSGLWDVSEGETVSFDPGTEITVNLPFRLVY